MIARILVTLVLVALSHSSFGTTVGVPSKGEIQLFCPHFLPSTIKITEEGWEVSAKGTITRVLGPKWTRTHEWEMYHEDVTATCGLANSGQFTHHYFKTETLSGSGVGQFSPVSGGMPSEMVLAKQAYFSAK